MSDTSQSIEPRAEAAASERGISRWFVAAAFLCMIPVLLPTYPPMVDLPQHLAAIMVLNEVHFGDYEFAEMFAFNWYRPYWYGYFLIWALSHVVGLIWAAKIVIGLAMTGLVLSLAMLRREIAAPRMIDWLFLAVPFGFAYHWGFLSFIVCAPLGPLFLVYYHRFLQGQVSGWIIAGWMLVLFFGHLLMLAFFCLTASVMALRAPLNLRALVYRIGPMLIAIPLGVTWMLLNVEPRNVEDSLRWSLGVHRLMSFLPELFSLPGEPQQVIIALFLLLLPFGLGVRPRWSLSTLAPATFYLLFMMTVPSIVFANFGTYERFQIFGLMFYALMLADADIRPPEKLIRLGPLLYALPGLVGFVLLFRVAVAAQGFDRESADFRTVMMAAEPRSRALSLIGLPNSEFTRLPTYIHFPLWYQVERQGLVDFNFAQYPSLNSYYKPEFRSQVDGSLVWYPAQFDWQRHGGDNYRYFIVRGTTPFISHVFRNDFEKVTPVASQGDWILLERTLQVE